jgi:CubicO group peptidase (beta-lactamase class C family)
MGLSSQPETSQEPCTYRLFNSANSATNVLACRSMGVLSWGALGGTRARGWITILVVASLTAASACSSGGDGDNDGIFSGDQDLESAEQSESSESSVYPVPDWAVAEPAELGFDPAILEQLAAEVDPETSCLVVTRHGKIVGEWYWNDWTAESTEPVLSVTQAYTSTLVGIAQDEGLLDLDDKVSEYVPEWVGTPSEDVTIRNLLSHDSGRMSTEGVVNSELQSDLLAAEDPAAFAVGLEQVAEPGTTWSQNLPAIEVLKPVLMAATGQDPATYAQEKLFGPIGAQNTSMAKNSAGNTIMRSFLETSCRDAARFGYLFLRNGNWDGTQVVSEEWVQQATQPSQDLNAGFGFMWWLNGPGSLISIDEIATPSYSPDPERMLVPEAPDDMYWAIGLQGRVIQVHPATDTVVVRLGPGQSEATNVQLAVRTVTEALVDS